MDIHSNTGALAYAGGLPLKKKLIFMTAFV